jgi:outer membrane protein assembly factor BamB
MRPTRFPLVPSLPWVLLVTVMFAAPALATDWPQWRGPERNGKSPDRGLMDRWPEGGPPLVYRVSGLGTGYSSLAVVDDRIYTLGDLEDGQNVLALDRETGKRLWATRIGPPWKDKYGGPRSTPTVDGDRLYALGTEGELVCLETAGGSVVWKRSLPEDFGGRVMSIRGTNWKFAESPLVDGDRLVVTPGARDATMVALDKRTGEEIWRTKISELGPAGADGAAYSSIVVSQGGGVRQYVQLMGRGAIGVDAKSGKLLWGYNRVANEVANIATPIVDGDHVFVSTGYGTGAALLRLKGDGDGGVDVEEVYFLDGQTLQNHHGGLILDDGHIYTGTGHNKGFPICVEMASGKVAWGPVRNDGQDSAAVTYADDKLFFRYQNGLMVLIEASPEGYYEKGSFLIPDVHQFSWSHPVVAGGRLYLREQDNLFCYDVREGAEPPAPATGETETR